MSERSNAVSHEPIAEILRHREMSIAGYDCRNIDLSFREPMLLPFGKVISRPCSWVTFNCKIDGRIYMGQGEGATLHEPLFTDDSGRNIRKNSLELGEALVNHGPATTGELVSVIRNYNFNDGGNYPTARLAVEVALLDSFAHSQETSIRDMLDISPDLSEVAYGKSIGANTSSAILEQAREALDRNASKIKIKISPHTFTEVLHALREIRNQFPTIELMVDANGTFDPNLSEHLELLEVLDAIGLSLIEEPVSRQGVTRGLDAVKVLRSRLPDLETRICLDDCLKTSDDCISAINEGLGEVINIKPGRIGSFVGSVELVNLAKLSNVYVMVGGMFEATPGRCVTTVLAAYCAELGCAIPGDISLAQERLVDDLVSPDRQLQLSPRGNILIPTGIGWGY